MNRLSPSTLPVMRRNPIESSMASSRNALAVGFGGPVLRCCAMIVGPRCQLSQPSVVRCEIQTPSKSASGRRGNMLASLLEGGAKGMIASVSYAIPTIAFPDPGPSPIADPRTIGSPSLCDAGLHLTRGRIRSGCGIGKASVRIRKGSASSLYWGIRRKYWTAVASLDRQ
jgi:hypothetical protein